MYEQQHTRRNNACLDAGTLIIWRDGALPLREADEVTAHVTACARCSAEDRALNRNCQQVFDLLSRLDPPSGADAALAIARFRKRFTSDGKGSVLHYDDENIHQEEIPLSRPGTYQPSVIPMKSSTRMRGIGALAQTLAAVLVVAAFLGASLLLFRHRLPSTAYHPANATQTYATSTAQAIPTAADTANSYDSFVAINGIMFGFDAQQTRANPYERILNPTTVGGLTKKWAYDMGSSVLSSPTVAHGMVYIGCVCGYVDALDAVTGAKKWAYRTGSQVSSSAAVADGIVYIGSYDDHTLYALDAATGAKKWAYRTNGSIDSSPTVVGRMVFVGSDDNTLYALDAATGAKKWTYWTRGSIYSSPAVSGGVVYVGSDDGNVYALDAASGKKKWIYPTGNSVYTSLAVSDGVVYVGSGDGNVYALDTASGAKKWVFQTGGYISSSPAVSGGVVYVGSRDGNVYALDAASGKKKWVIPINGDMSSDPMLAGGLIYFGSRHGTLYALNATSGTIKWAYQDGSTIDTSPVVADGVVYYGSLNGNLYAFHLPGT